MPAKAIAFPGAKSDGLFNHKLSVYVVHFIDAFDVKALEYSNPSPDAMFESARPPSDGPVICATYE